MPAAAAPVAATVWATATSVAAPPIDVETGAGGQIAAAQITTHAAAPCRCCWGCTSIAGALCQLLLLLHWLIAATAAAAAATVQIAAAAIAAQSDCCCVNSCWQLGLCSDNRQGSRVITHGRPSWLCGEAGDEAGC